jgi:hypothetical protein
MCPRSIHAAIVILGVLLPARVTIGDEAASLAARLRKVASSPIYLVQSDRGLFARSMDGRLKQTLLSGSVCSALYDGGTEVVFFPRNRKLWVLDLREANPQPVAVLSVRGESSERPAKKRECWDYSVSAPDGESQSTTKDISMTFDWKRERVMSEGRSLIVVGTWLRQNVTRPIRERQEPVAMSGKQPSPFGKTGLSFVSHPSQDDSSFGRCLLKNQAGNFFRPEELRRVWIIETGKPNCSGHGARYQLDLTQRAWLGSDGPCTAQACIKLGKSESMVGWLDPGPELFLDAEAP